MSPKNNNFFKFNFVNVSNVCRPFKCSYLYDNINFLHHTYYLDIYFFLKRYGSCHRIELSQSPWSPSDRSTTLRLIPRLISLSLRLYPHPPRADAFRRVMLMKDDYAKTRAISVFDLTTWNRWSTADQDESLTFTYNRYGAITQHIKICCNYFIP